jgi:hypothetical protein
MTADNNEVKGEVYLQCVMIQAQSWKLVKSQNCLHILQDTQLCPRMSCKILGLHLDYGLTKEEQVDSEHIVSKYLSYLSV